MKDLSWYRNNIELPKFIVDNYPFHFDKDSSRNSPKLRSNDGSQVISLVKYQNGWKYFFKTSSEKGDIIDWVQKRENIFNLGKARGIIENYMGSPSYSNALFNSPDNAGGNDIPVKPLSDYFVPQDFSIGEKPFQFKVMPLEDTSYLNFRLIPDKVLFNKMFIGTVYNSLFFDPVSSRSYVNTTFPIYSKHELITPPIQKCDQRRVAALQTYYKKPDGTSRKIFFGPKGDGIWRSNVDPDKPVNSLILTEQPLHAKSHAILNPNVVNNNDMYYSFFGQFSSKQLDMAVDNIHKGLFMDFINNERFNKPKILVFAFDNDGAGAKYTLQFLNKLEPLKFTGDKPSKENEYLLSADFSPIKWDKVEAQVKISFKVDNKVKGLENIARFKEHFFFFKKSSVFDDNVLFKWGETSFDNNKASVILDFKNRAHNWQVINKFLVENKFSGSKKLLFSHSIENDWSDDLKVAKQKGLLGKDGLLLKKTLNDEHAINNNLNKKNKIKNFNISL